MNILDKIVGKKKKRLEIRKRILPQSEIIKKVNSLPATKDFLKAISGNKVSIIAEIKKESPSAGVILKRLYLKKIVSAYNETGVNAISVLTEEDFFKGRLPSLMDVRDLTELPILRKDFIIDEYQVYESRFFGADCILLISRILTQERIEKLLEIAHSLTLDCLVEVDSEAQLRKVLNTKAKIIGINNRNLKNFKIDLSKTKKLIKKIPKDKIIVSESGIKSLRDVSLLKTFPLDAVLIGQYFLQAKDRVKRINDVKRLLAD